MSFEEIITAIQNKPEIWMSKHVLYKNRIVKAKIWKELAQKLAITGKNCFINFLYFIVPKVVSELISYVSGGLGRTVVPLI